MNPKILSVIAVLLLCIPALPCADVSAGPASEPVSAGTDDDAYVPEYAEGEILVRSAFFDARLLNVPYVSEEPIFPGSHWHKVVLSGGIGAPEAADAVRASGAFEEAELNYVHAVQTVDVSGNPSVSMSEYLDVMGIRDAWSILEEMGVSPGGDRNVTIGVMDTGVDYGHEDLKGNIWRNADEIPDNGIDDDGNGYVDDVLGWNFAYGTSDPMDDNGHGTHVAGIIGAEDNDVGTVGVAFNCRIMCLKAGDDNGRFDDADIAAAVNYAAVNGADVLNMSVGGSGSCGPVRDALADTADRLIAVAAAGNSSMCSNTQHSLEHEATPFYPGGFPETIGVMSVTQDGQDVSWFSNYDDTPYDSVEYDVYATGSDVYSTFIGNRYATLNGTSMATPVVSGVVALVLSSDPDRERLTPDMVRAAVVNSGSIHPYNKILGERDMYHAVCDAADALDPDRVPFVNPGTPIMQDGRDLSAANNGDGRVDAGETLRIGADVFNRGFDASDVRMSLVSSDPYLECSPGAWSCGDVPVYTEAKCGMDDGHAGHSFTAKVSPDCPDGHVIEYRFFLEYGDPEHPGRTLTNSMTERIEVHRDRVLPSVFTEDTVLDSTFRYIVNGDIEIPAGVSVVFGEGCTLWADGHHDVTVRGSLEIRGTDDRRASLDGNGSHPVRIVCSDADARMVFVCCDVHGFCITSEFEDNHERIWFDRCTVDTVSEYLGGNMLALGNFDHSIYNGRFEEGTVSGAVGSVLSMGTVMQAVFNGAPVRDTVILMESDWYSDSTVVLEADLSNVLMANTAADDPCPCEFVKKDGVTVDRLCFEAGFRGYDGLPSVPFSGLDTGRMWPMVIGLKVLDEDGRETDSVDNGRYTVSMQLSRGMSPDAVPEIGWDHEMSSSPAKVWDGYLETPTDLRFPISLVRMESDGRITVNASGGHVPGGFAGLTPTEGYIGFGMTVRHDADLSVEPLRQGNGAEVMFEFAEYPEIIEINVYRSDSEDGELIRLNDAPLVPYLQSFEDRTAVPGETYWYTVDRVYIDMKENEPQERVRFTVPKIIPAPLEPVFSDTLAKMSFSVVGDMVPETVTVSYLDGDTWKTADAVRTGDHYEASVPSGDPGELRYFVTVSDGIHSFTLGSADDPLTLQVDGRDTGQFVFMALVLIALALFIMLGLGRH